MKRKRDENNAPLAVFFFLCQKQGGFFVNENFEGTAALWRFLLPVVLFLDCTLKNQASTYCVFDYFFS